MNQRIFFARVFHPTFLCFYRVSAGRTCMQNPKKANPMQRFKFLYCVLFMAFIAIGLAGQAHFPYRVELETIELPGLPGLHSYAFGQADGKWILIGGRTDGLHAPHAYSSFPASGNNTNIYVVDIQSRTVWSTTINTLSLPIREQLQSTNMNFFQAQDTLYIIGGYAYSESADDHITFPRLCTVQISPLIDAILNNQVITPYFKQITNDIFAVTGGQLGRIGHTFYLVGGQRFDGRYNPIGMPSFTQEYCCQIRQFEVDNSGSQIQLLNPLITTDSIHLHRRDYNLLPLIQADQQRAYLLSSGVFQKNVDLPYLYPVEITPNDYTPHTNFNQYLSHYHSARAALYDSLTQNMTLLFFGGMSQYYYQDGHLIQDDWVPFVNTISSLNRDASGQWQEYQLDTEMPGLEGTSAEFIHNHNLPHDPMEIFFMHRIEQDTIALGHIFGGLISPLLHPFNNHQTDATAASSNIYAVTLIRQTTGINHLIDGKNPYSMLLFPNPATGNFSVRILMDHHARINYSLATINGQIIDEKNFSIGAGMHSLQMELPPNIQSQALMVHLLIDHKHHLCQRLVVRSPIKR